MLLLLAEKLDETNALGRSLPKTLWHSKYYIDAAFPLSANVSLSSAYRTSLVVFTGLQIWMTAQ